MKPQGSRTLWLGALFLATSTAIGGCAGGGGGDSEEPAPTVIIESPVPTGKVAKADGNKEECTTSCSLAKHPVPPFDELDYELAIQHYADELPGVESESFEQLLFYGPRTVHFMKELGTEGLSQAHLDALERELARDHALVSLRLVDESNGVVASYGPERVPIGIKQHLAPSNDELQAMEFNGTVMRTGVNYLWARY